MKSSNRAFTLIELLVVISIIAVLVSLLLPSLGKARETAVQLNCMARMRGFSVHIESYRNDYKLWYTPNSRYNSILNPFFSFDGSFETLIRPYLPAFNAAHLSYGSPNTIKPSLNPYICPTMIAPPDYTATTMRRYGGIEGASWFGNYRIGSYYGYGSASDSDNQINRRCKREVVGPPSTMILMGEWAGVTPFCGDYGNVSGAIYRHADVTNLTYADGHGSASRSMTADIAAKTLRVQQ
jgi:prepilin-type N-terminal cleavage/methylation domain-containing protein/prepilin-type processing-associated H-X9-DG protein